MITSRYSPFSFSDYQMHYNIPVIDPSEDLQMNAIKIEKVIKNDDAVIVLWTDKTKTVVKLMDGDTDDIYSAVAQAMAKKIYGEVLGNFIAMLIKF